MVNEFCTCGAQLPPDAKFCHKCGKPQVELPVPETMEEPPPPPPPPLLVAEAQPVVLPPVSWRNPTAVRVSILAGTVAALLLLLPLPPPINVLWQFIVLFAGGFWAVHIYRKRTGEDLRTRSGAKLGWMAGLICFVIMMVVFTVGILAVTWSGGLQTYFRDGLVAAGNAEMADQFEALLRSPAGIAALLFGMLLTSFLALTLLATLGGIVGAKVLKND